MYRRAIVGVVSAACVLLGTGSAQAAERPESACPDGQFCVWSSAQYGGQLRQVDLSAATPSVCFPLQGEYAAFANRTARDITVYTGARCSTEQDFVTYPGGGTYVPESPFVVRGIEIWSSS